MVSVCAVAATALNPGDRQVQGGKGSGISERRRQLPESGNARENLVRVLKVGLSNEQREGRRELDGE